MHRSAPVRHRLATWIVLVVVATLAACTPPTPPAPTPSVTSFTATPSSLVAGDAATLAWVVEDATSVAVATTGGAAVVESDELAGDVPVSPTETTTYLLTATGPGGTAEAEVTVTVQPALPQVVFTAAPLGVDAGDPSTLSWSVDNATSVDIATAGGDPVVTGGAVSGTIDVRPTVTTTYVLLATGPGGQAEADVTVTVFDPTEPAPVIDTFTATPATIVSGASSTLAWTTTNATAIEIETLGGTPVHATNTVDGSFPVTLTTTTVYVLSATGPGGTVTGQASVTVTGSAPVISSFTATVVEGSRLSLAWAASGATSFQVVAVRSGAPTDTTPLVASTTETSATVAIPAANRQLLRLIATGPGGDDTFEVTPENVVTNALDYDVYNGTWWIEPPEPVAPGSLRAVVANAAPGSVIGFASDVTDIALYGVDIFDPKTDVAYGPAAPEVPTVDSHLNLLRDVTISGPVGSAVTLRSVAHPDSTDLDGFSWRSRVLFVARGRTASLSNLRIADGTFIFVGAGVRNDGALTMTDVLVEDNRAWQFGGGIANVGGTLTLERVTVRGNVAATLDDEVGEIFRIRQNTINPIGSAPVANLTSTDDGYGGGLANLVGPGGVSGSVTAVDSSFDLNEAKLMGGGVYSTTGSVTFTDTDVTGNRAYLEGYAPWPAARSDGLLSYGGGVGSDGVFTMAGGVVTGNVSTHIGGGFTNFAGGTATLTNVGFDSNTAEFYGCISNEAAPAAVELTNVTCTNSGTTPIEGLGVGPSLQRAPVVAPNPSGASFR
jgi:hypothetical protein